MDAPNYILSAFKNDSFHGELSPEWMRHHKNKTGG
jgi:hypothetical protein